MSIDGKLAGCGQCILNVNMQADGRQTFVWPNRLAILPQLPTDMDQKTQYQSQSWQDKVNGKLITVIE